MVDALVPGHRYASGAQEMWAMVIGMLAGWEQRANDAAAEVGLSPVSAWALVQLDPKAPPISQKELARRLKCNPSSVVDSTDRLEQAGMVVRKPNRADRRVNVLVVTPKGVKARKLLISRLLDPPAAFRKLGKDQQARFRALMSEVLSQQTA